MLRFIKRFLRPRRKPASPKWDSESMFGTTGTLREMAARLERDLRLMDKAADIQLEAAKVSVNRSKQVQGRD